MGQDRLALSIWYRVSVPDDPSTETSATQGLQVNGIGSTPFNIAVGGTDFNQTSANESQYWNGANDTNTWESAKGYIPETPWNDSTNANGTLVNNVPATYSGSTVISGAKPSWQSSFGSANARQLPDVSLFAADGVHDSACYAHPVSARTSCWTWTAQRILPAHLISRWSAELRPPRRLSPVC